MRIGIVGGIERSEGAYHAVALAGGHALRFHSGHLTARGTTALADMVRTADLLIVVTEVNSHGAVKLARRLARTNGVAVMMLRRCSPARLSVIVADLAGRGDIGAVAAT